MREAFSLVELSVVLVILGLLTGGILSGQALIRASQLRAITTEFSRYATATYAFRDKYFQLPGDINNAETIWGTQDAVAATCRTTASTSSLTCNGDGDSAIESTGTRSYEIYRYWQHLANAGLIEGSFNGTTTSANWGTVLGGNVPASKYPKGGWAVVSLLDVTQQGGFYTTMFQPKGATHWYEFGTNTSVTSYLNDALLKNEEAWNVDSKADDGMPGMGKITTFNNTRQSTCASSDTAASATYQLTQSAAACVLFFGF